MAFVIFSAGALAQSRMHTVRMRTLVVAAGALVLTVLLSGVAVGFHLGSTSLASGRGAGLPGLPDLDWTQPGNQALIHQIGALSGRLIRLEALASRLAERTSAAPATATRAQPAPARSVAQPAGGPLIAPLVGSGPGVSESLLRLDLDLDGLETDLGRVAATLERSDLDGMAFPSREPIPGAPISSGFGRRSDPFTGEPARHMGIDFAAPFGTPIFASAGGRVRYAGPRGAYGRTVEIDHGDGLITRYGHVSRILVRVGDILLPGQQVATVGSTGRSNGPHVHFEVLRDGIPVHPGLYLANDGS